MCELSWSTQSLRSLLLAEFAGAWGEDTDTPERANMRVLRSTNLSDDGSVNYATAAPRQFDESDAERKRLFDGDLIIEASGGGPNKPVGRVALFCGTRDERQYACSNFFRTLRPNSGIVDPRYLFRVLNRLYSQPEIWRFQQQTTGIVNLRYVDYLSTEISIPSLIEQRRITEILDAVDEQIRAMARMCRKADAGLDGILHKLFVSVAESDSQAQCLSLRDSARWLSGGTPATGVAEYWDGDIPWISAASLKNFYISTSDRNVSSLGAAAGSRIVPTGTTICIVRGMSLKSEFRVGVTTRRVAFGQDCKAMIPVDGIDPWYFGYSVRALEPRILTLVDEAGHGTGRLDTRLLQNLCIYVPNLAGQSDAVRIAQEAERQLRTYEAESAKLRALKQALLDDLLTGRVRVPVGAEG